MPGQNPATDPVWDDDGTSDVQSFFKNPAFVSSDPAVRTRVATTWYNCMQKHGGILLYDNGSTQNNVFANGQDIYGALLSGYMPEPIPDFCSPFPPDVLETFRIWYNQGGRVHKGDPYPTPPSPQISPPPIPVPARDVHIPTNPVWDASGTTEDDIKMCFTDPCWIPNGSVSASEWQSEMKQFQYDAISGIMFDLQQYAHVQGWARNIYFHIASQSMPINPPYFTANAAEMFRLWYNSGCPQTTAQLGKVIPPTDPIPPEPVEKQLRIRKDINTLTQEELRDYRTQIQNLGSGEIQGSTWQVGGFLHANWCLHYMQASFPWHRAHLLWLESQINGPIPYWNFYSSQATTLTSGDSGIPQAFLDDTFVDAHGKTWPNPLLHAKARGGVSRASSTTSTQSEIQRNSAFSSTDNRNTWITQYVSGYLQQIHTAVSTTSIAAQSAGGAFTATFPEDLTPLNADSIYGTDNLQDFDGLLEQAHDNIHGWVGLDMSNNSYAAFDPLFWSFHANFDRIFESWVRENEQQPWGCNFPLRPFQGREGNITIDEGDPFLYNYTTIGDMVKNSKALGYSYAPPGNPDFAPLPSQISFERAPIILFPNSKCTDKTYFIHVGLDNGDGKKLVVGELGYIGSITRLGMGPNNGNDRCVKNGVLRRLEATKAVHDIGGIPPDSEVKLKMLVLQDGAGGPSQEIPKSEYSSWPGFKPVVIWGKPVGGIIAM